MNYRPEIWAGILWPVGLYILYVGVALVGGFTSLFSTFEVLGTLWLVGFYLLYVGVILAARWLAGSCLCSVGYIYFIIFFSCPGISPPLLPASSVGSPQLGVLPRLASVASVPLINLSSQAVVSAPPVASLPHPRLPVVPSTRPVFSLAQPLPPPVVSSTLLPVVPSHPLQSPPRL